MKRVRLKVKSSFMNIASGTELDGYAIGVNIMAIFENNGYPSCFSDSQNYYFEVLEVSEETKKGSNKIVSLRDFLGQDVESIKLK